MWKSVAVVLGSYILSIVLVLASDPILSRVFPGDFVRGNIPSNKALMASTVLFVLASIFCAWVCARFSPNRPEKHVLWFFIVGEVMGFCATVLNWNKGYPHWYLVAWLLTWPVSCWIGLMLARRRAEQNPAIG